MNFMFRFLFPVRKSASSNRLIFQGLKDHRYLSSLLESLPISKESLNHWKNLLARLLRLLIVRFITILADDDSILDLAQFDLRLLSASFGSA